MLAISLCIHLIFYVLGYFALTNVELLHDYGAKDIFFKNGMVFFNVIISILLLLFWLIAMFKNNGFQNFYPTSANKLFGQFLQYIIIVFSVTTFYISYEFGLKTYANSTYPDDILYTEIKKANEGAVFLSQGLDKYTLNNRCYPSPFDILYCEINNENMEYSRSKSTWLDLDYQFYTVKKQIFKKNESYPCYPIYQHYTNDTNICYCKDEVVRVIKNPDLTYSYSKTDLDLPNNLNSKPSFYNYSSEFYVSKKDKNSERSYYEEKEYYSRGDQRNKKINKFIFNLLNDKNHKERIIKILKDFLIIANKYKLEHNLTENKWFNLIYTDSEQAFNLAKFIRYEKKQKGTEIPRELAPHEQFMKDRLTDFYFETNNFRNVFDNIEEIRYNYRFLGRLHFFFWFALAFSILVFIFRTSGLRLLLFSLITGAIISIFVVLSVVGIKFLFSVKHEENYGLALSILIGIIVLLLPKTLFKRNLKQTTGLVLNLSLLGFSLFILFIFGLISDVQKDYLGIEYYDTLIKTLGFLLSPIIYIATLIFIYFRCFTIKKWKGLPEG